MRLATTVNMFTPLGPKICPCGDVLCVWEVAFCSCLKGQTFPFLFINHSVSSLVSCPFRFTSKHFSLDSGVHTMCTGKSLCEPSGFVVLCVCVCVRVRGIDNCVCG